MTTTEFHGLWDYEQAEDFANAMQDELADHARAYPGTPLESLARHGYDVAMRLLGHPGEDEE